MPQGNGSTPGSSIDGQSWNHSFRFATYSEISLSCQNTQTTHDNTVLTKCLFSPTVCHISHRNCEKEIEKKLQTTAPSQKEVTVLPIYYYIFVISHYPHRNTPESGFLIWNTRFVICTSFMQVKRKMY